MPTLVSLDEVAVLAGQLSQRDQLRLIEKLVHNLANGTTRPRRRWAEIRGKAPYPLCGTDAQEWISQGRQEADESRGD